MKRFYHSKEGYNTAILKCKNGVNEFYLHYHLYDNPVQHIWQKLHKHSKVKTSNVLPQTFEKLTKDLKQELASVGITNVPNTFDQGTLNSLHNSFVENKKDPHWYNINILIHALENKLDNPFSNYDSTVSFYSIEEQFVPIKDEYKIFLNTDVKWGRMNLGYGTLGKDWIHVSADNDNLDDLSLQSTISSETNLTFCVEPGIIGTDESKFYNWAKFRNDVPLNNLNKLSLGRYPLGQLIITETLLNFHNTPSDWYVPNHMCKLTWNKEVFNADVQVEEITFDNTDLLFESLVKHSNIGKIINV